MKFGVREICDVVLKAKATQKIGNKTFYKNEPVIYFDTLKTSSMEGAATTVYAQGGKGNSRLMAWEGERTVTFTMEDALISPAGFMILSGAGLVDAGSKSEDKSIKVHATEQIEVKYDDTSKKIGDILLSQKPYQSGSEDLIYVMVLDGNGEVDTEPYIYKCTETSADTNGKWKIVPAKDYDKKSPAAATDDVVVLVDYYVERENNVQQIDITPDKFGGNYYLEASTLFKNTAGVDMPAEFIIPNCKIQSNFTFTMASSGDPSAFTFTMDAFPDYTRFDRTKKVLAAIQIVTGDEDTDATTTDAKREQTHVAAESKDITDPNGEG